MNFSSVTSVARKDLSGAAFGASLAVAGAMALFGALFATSAEAAEQVTVGKLVVEGAWTRATPGGAKVGVGYVSIVNTGTEADRLMRATSTIAERVEVHTMTMDNGVMRMRQLKDGLALKARAVTELRPGGHHLMLIGLKQPIKEGDQVPVEITFATAGSVTLKLTAAGIGAVRPPHGSSAADAVAGSQSGQAVSDDGQGSHAEMNDSRDSSGGSQNVGNNGGSQNFEAQGSTNPQGSH